VMSNRLSLESTRVHELDVCSTADTATGEGRPMISELEPRHVVSRFASAGETGMEKEVL
jgi:hypothetical protein